MAIFQETHPLPFDPITKRPLTGNDIEFLKKLQYELNTQDSMGNRSPRFWVIKESQKTYVSRDNCYDYVTITDEQNPGFEIWNLDVLFDVMSRMITDRTVPYEITKNADGYIVLTNTDDDSSELIREITEDTVETLNRIAENDSRFTPNYVSSGFRIVPDTLFLTHKACEEHLRKYSYNYTSDAHAYAMTADRSPEFETLLDLLQQIDLEQLSKLQALAKVITP